MSERTEKILNMAKNHNRSLLFLPKYETTKGLEKCYQQHVLSVISSQSSSEGLLTDVYNFEDYKKISVQRPNIQQDIKKNEQELDDITKEKNDNFKFESTKYLKMCNQEKLLGIRSHQSRSKEILMNVYEFKDEEEICVHRPNKENELEKNTYILDVAQEKNNKKTIPARSSGDIELLHGNNSKPDIKYAVNEEQIIPDNDNDNGSENKKVEANKILIIENLQIRPPQYQNSEEISELLKVSHKQKLQQPGTYKYPYDSDEIEETFQSSSGSEYLPTSDDEEKEELPCFYEEMISENEGTRTKKTENDYNKVQGKKTEQNEIMTRKGFNINHNNYECSEISLDYAPSIKKVKPNGETSQLANTSKNVDRFVVGFGKLVEPPPPNVESHLSRSQDKKTTCSYCLKDVTHFSRHLMRNHNDEGAVKEFLSFPPNHQKRKILLDTIRRQGNFVSSLSTNNIRPVRRPKETENLDTSYVCCPDCMGFFRRKYLRRHRKQCSSRFESTTKRENHLSLAQVFTVCSGAHGDFLSTLRLKRDVFPIMRNDDISRTAMNDMLICSYGESLLRKPKRSQIRNVISNKMRELGRLLIILRKVNGIRLLFDVLKPQFFDNIVGAVRVISGYCEETKTFKASSLALHMGTTLKQVCDIATKNIIKKSPIVSCANDEQSLKDIKRLKNLIENHWSSEISSLALKNLKENNYGSPKLLPLTQDVVKFQSFVMKEANEVSNSLKENININLNYRKLTECVLVLTLLINRKRIGEIQYLKTETYNTKVKEHQQSEFLDCLSKTEQMLCKNFKRVVTGGKGSRPVAILFPPDIQNFIELLISFRNYCMPATNPYLFANPKTDGWLSGYHIVKNMAEKAGVSDTSLFTSTRLRKQIATVLQAINIKEDEIEQFATFMGHTKNTHQSYYRLPQDLYQTAKVSKLLIAINSGKAGKYKGKSLDEITVSDNESIPDDTEAEEPNRYDQNDHCVTEIETVIDDQEVNNTLLDKREIKMKTRSGVRGKWTAEQKKIVKIAFEDHIKNKRAPRKQEVELFMKKYGDLYADKSWVTVKAFIYNTYRDS